MSVRGVLKKLGIALASVLITVVLAEVVARLAEPGPFSFYDRSAFEPAEKFHHVHRKNFQGRWDGTWYETNSLGLRGGELRPTLTPEEFRVLAIGDSCTFGKGVHERETWPRQFEALIDAALPEGQRVLVANAGVNGYSSGDYLEVLRQRGAELSPQLVIVGYNLNDFPNQTKQTDERVHQGQGNLRAAIPRGMRDYLSRFASFRWLRATYYVMNRERDYAAAERMAGAARNQNARDPKRVAREIANLEAMAAESAAMGAKFCVFLFPYESQVYLNSYDAASVEWLRGLCAERNIPFVSVVDEFRTAAASETPPRRLFLRGDRYHPNAEGYGIVAAKVLTMVRGQGWLPRKP